MSRNGDNEKFSRMQWHDNGTKAEVFEYEKQIGNNAENGIHGIYQSGGMNVFQTGNKKDALSDFKIPNTFTESYNGDRSRKSRSETKKRTDKSQDNHKYQPPAKEHEYVLPLNHPEDGLQEYAGVIEDLNTGETQYVRGFTNGPNYQITGNDPEEMKKFAKLLKNINSDDSSESEDSSDESED